MTDECLPELSEALRRLTGGRPHRAVADVHESAIAVTLVLGIDVAVDVRGEMPRGHGVDLARAEEPGTARPRRRTSRQNRPCSTSSSWWTPATWRFSTTHVGAGVALVAVQSDVADVRPCHEITVLVWRKMGVLAHGAVHPGDHHRPRLWQLLRQPRTGQTAVSAVVVHVACVSPVARRRREDSSCGLTGTRRRPRLLRPRTHRHARSPLRRGHGHLGPDDPRNG